MVISVISAVISVISVDFGDFWESCYPSNLTPYFFVYLHGCRVCSLTGHR